MYTQTKKGCTKTFLDLIKQRRQVRRKQKQALNRDTNLSLKPKYNKLTKLIRQEKVRHDKAQWEQYCEKLKKAKYSRLFWQTFRVYEKNTV